MFGAHTQRILAGIDEKLEILMLDRRELMAKLDDIIVSLNEVTNQMAEAAQADSDRMSALRTDLLSAKAAGTPVSDEQLAALAAIQTRQSSIVAQLRAMGSDPANPVPTPPTTP